MLNFFPLRHQALSMPYILHPVKDGGNEEVNYVYPLLLVTGIVLSGKCPPFLLVKIGRSRGRTRTL